MPRVGRPVAEPRRVRLVPERGRDRAADDDAAERQVAAGDALRERDHVRADAPALRPEPLAEPPEAGDHRVDHVQDAGALAQRVEALDVALARLMHAAGADHRLDEHGGHAVGADALDLGLQRLERVVRHLGRVGVERADVGAVGGDAADARPEPVRAVVALRARDQVHALGLADRREVAARQLRRGVDRVAAAAGEEDARAVDGRERGEPVGQLARGLVVERAERAVGGELAHLRGGRVGELRAAVADVDVPQAGGAVEISPALLIGHMDAVAADERELGRAGRVHVRERMPEM